MGETALALKGYRREHGLLWPDYDQRCAEVTFRETDAAVPAILEHVVQRRVAVQAGGNCGQFVTRLAAAFGAVYTFEPEPRNFTALAVNTAGLGNVFKFQAALGGPDDRGWLCGLKQGDAKYPANCGAWYAGGLGNVPTLTVDDLGLACCDLLALDVEGAELAALVGAERTIRQARPVVVIEDKGLGEKFYGRKPGAAAAWLAERGYRRGGLVGRDLILVPS